MINLEKKMLDFGNGRFPLLIFQNRIIELCKVLLLNMALIAFLYSIFCFVASNEIVYHTFGP